MGLKLVVVCPANAVTGGPEAMHQLVHTANHVERGSAAILYWPFLKQATVRIKGCSVAHLKLRT